MGIGSWPIHHVEPAGCARLREKVRGPLSFGVRPVGHRIDRLRPARVGVLPSFPKVVTSTAITSTPCCQLCHGDRLRRCDHRPYCISARANEQMSGGFAWRVRDCQLGLGLPSVWPSGATSWGWTSHGVTASHHHPTARGQIHCGSRRATRTMLAATASQALSMRIRSGTKKSRTRPSHSARSR